MQEMFKEDVRRFVYVQYMVIGDVNAIPRPLLGCILFSKI